VVPAPQQGKKAAKLADRGRLLAEKRKTTGRALPVVSEV
jgi:hypothetical protein